MGLIGPRVLNYLGESKVKAAKIQLQSFRERARPVLSRRRPLSLHRGRTGRTGAADAGRRRLERTISEGRRRAQRSLEPRLSLSRRPASTAPTTSCPMGPTVRKAAAGPPPTFRSRTPTAPKMSEVGATRLHPARDGLRARDHRAARRPCCCRSSRARRRASRLQAYALQAATLLKADRNAAIRRQASVATLVDAASARDPLRGVAGGAPHSRRCATSTRCCRRPAEQRAALSTISFFANGTSCGGTIALTRFDAGYRNSRQLADRKDRDCFPRHAPSTERRDAGFTIIEVLVALAIVAVVHRRDRFGDGGQCARRALARAACRADAGDAHGDDRRRFRRATSFGPERRRDRPTAIAGRSMFRPLGGEWAVPGCRCCLDPRTRQDPRHVPRRRDVRYSHRSADAEVIRMNVGVERAAQRRTWLHADRNHCRAGADGAGALRARQHHRAMAAELESRPRPHPAQRSDRDRAAADRRRSRRGRICPGQSRDHAVRCSMDRSCRSRSCAPRWDRTRVRDLDVVHLGERRRTAASSSPFVRGCVSRRCRSARRCRSRCISAIPVVLLRAPFRLSFAYAGPDRVWKSTWQEADKLPAMIRLTVRDAGQRTCALGLDGHAGPCPDAERLHAAGRQLQRQGRQAG